MSKTVFGLDMETLQTDINEYLCEGVVYKFKLFHSVIFRSHSISGFD